MKEKGSETGKEKIQGNTDFLDVIRDHMELLCLQQTQLGIGREMNLPLGSPPPLPKVYPPWPKSQASIQICPEAKI